MPDPKRSSPAVTVVVPSHSRQTRLAFTLEALAAQTLDGALFEVVVVRDTGSPAPPPAPPGLDVRFVSHPAPGILTGRNRGWAEARAELIAFTDDDCRPAPDWLERLLEASSGSELEILEGSTEPDPDERHLLHGLNRSMEVRGPTRWYPTCNIAYPRALLERLGGFDEELGFFGEDTDLGLRAEAAGARLVFVDDALVWHAVHVRSLRSAVADATGRNAEPEILARHPRMRDELYLGAFISEEHARLALALAGVALAPRSRAIAALAAYPYLIHTLAKRPVSAGFASPRGLTRLAADIGAGAIVGGAELASRLGASIRHRRLVL